MGYLMKITDLEGYSITFQKFSIMCSMWELFIILNATGLQEIYEAFFNKILKK